MVSIYLPLIVLVAALAWLSMDYLTSARNDIRTTRDVARDPHIWVVSLLYIGTFGSFIGFGLGLGQVLQVQFKAGFPTPLDAAYLTFIGPLLGSLVRPVGGLLADRFRSARITFWNFVAMALGAVVVLVASLNKSLPLFIVGFVVLFVLSGLGNGPTYKMIPAIFRARSALPVTDGADRVTSDREAARLPGALIGIAGAIGAFGGVLVNVAFRQSFPETGAGNAAYLAFIAFYVLCLVVTPAVYLRPSASRLAGV